MVVVKDGGSRLKRHLEIIGIIAKEIIKPDTITIEYPKEERVYDNIRGYVVFDYRKCIGCLKCARICPANAITVKSVKSRFYPSIDYGKCIFCHFCIDVCPTNALENSRIHDLVFDSHEIVLNPDKRIVYDVKRKEVRFEG